MPLFKAGEREDVALSVHNLELTPLRLKAGDFDGDGIPDLVSCFAGADGALLTFQKGNVDSIFPNTEKAHLRRREGSFLDAPFHPVSQIVESAETPDFVATGDLDSDRKLDIVLARRGFSHFSYLLGRGDGSFEAARKRELPGEITAFASGEVNLRDGRVDLVIGVNSQEGPRLLVLQSPYGAVKAIPTSVELSKPASAITTGQFNEDLFMDVAFSMGDQLMLLPGRVEAVFPDNWIEGRIIWVGGSRILDLTTGDFSGDQRKEIAVLEASGVLTMVQPETETTLHARVLGDGHGLAATGNPVARIITTRVSNFPHDDLAFYDGRGDLLIFPGRQDAWPPSSWRDSKGEAAVLRLPFSPVDLLPMRLNPDGLSDLVLLRREPEPIVILQTAPVRTITVDRDGDEGDFSGADGRCDIDNNDSNGPGCTLKAALAHASSFSVEDGASEIVFALDKLENVGTAFAFRPVLINGGGVEIVGRIRLAGTDSVVRDITLHGGFPADSILSRLQIEGSNMRVESSWIGTDGERASTGSIEFFGGNGNTVGGMADEARNVLSQVTAAGGADGNKILGNHIWVNEAGDEALTFEGPRVLFNTGVRLLNTGSSEVLNNLISGAVEGISVSSRSQANTISGNKIGTDKEGASPLGNERNGILINSSSLNLVDDNLIAFNQGDGISAVDGTLGEEPSQGNRFLGNRIHSNGGLGIDLRINLADDGVTPNDIEEGKEDEDVGPNNLQNFPTKLAVTPAGFLFDGKVEGTLEGMPGTYRVEIFSNTECDPSGNGEGETFVTAGNVTIPSGENSDPSGENSEDFEFELSSSVDTSLGFTATATAVAEGNTSEFSECTDTAEPGGPIDLRPKLLLGNTTCEDQPTQEIIVTALPEGDDITTDPSVEYWWIGKPGTPSGSEIAMTLEDKLNEFLSKLTGVSLPDVAILERSGKIITFKSEGINVLLARRGEERSYALVVSGGLELAAAESLDINPRSLLTNFVLDSAATVAEALVSKFTDDFQFDAPMVLFPSSEQPCSAVGNLLGREGLVGIDSLKFRFFNGAVDSFDLMNALNTVFDVPIRQDPVLWFITEALKLVVENEIKTFISFRALGDDPETGAQEDTVIDVSNEESTIRGIVSAAKSGISAVVATFSGGDYCIKGEASDLMFVWVLPDLEEVDIRTLQPNGNYRREDPILLNLADKRKTVLVGSFNGIAGESGALEIDLDSVALGRTETALIFLDKLLPGPDAAMGIPGSDGFEVRVPPDPILKGELRVDGNRYLNLRYRRDGTKVTFEKLRLQTVLPRLATSWSMRDTNIATVDPEGLVFSDADIEGVRPGETKLTAEACITLTSLSTRQDSNPVLVGGGTIAVQKYNDLLGDGDKDPGDVGIDAWEITLENLGTGETRKLLTLSEDLNGDGMIDPSTEQGWVFFRNLDPGAAYRVIEEKQADWTLTSQPVPNLTVEEGQQTTVRFGNFRHMLVHGIKFEDLNGDGRYQLEEQALSNWTIELDINSDGVVDLTTLTDAQGNYRFPSVPPGDISVQPLTLTIREVPQAGWFQTKPKMEHRFAMKSGLVVTADFGNFRVFDIHGSKFDDVDGNGDRRAGEPGLEGWEIRLDFGSDGSIELRTTTDSNGAYLFEDAVPSDFSLLPLTVTISEEERPGYTRTVPPDHRPVPIQSGQDIELDFGNFQNMTLAGRKFHDENENGLLDSGESGLRNWTIQMDLDSDGVFDETTTTGPDGFYEFTDIGPPASDGAALIVVQEQPVEGWVPTGPQPEGGYRIDVHSGIKQDDLIFGNRDASFEAVRLCGVKFEDLDGNGSRDEGEPGIPSWTIERVSPDGEVASLETDDQGLYCFEEVEQGPHEVREVQQEGWVATFPATAKYLVAPESGTDRTDLDFGNFQQGRISGTKFHDLNGDGVRNASEGGLEGWAIFLDQDGDGQLDHPAQEGQCDEASLEPCAVTGPDGSFAFEDLEAGSYLVREVDQAGWIQTTEALSAFEVMSSSNFQNADLGNFEAAVVTGRKFRDLDRNGTADDGEPGLPGWTIFLDVNEDGILNNPFGDGVCDAGAREMCAVTGQDGIYSIGQILPGVYRPSEVQQDNWVAIGPPPDPIVVESSGTAFSGIDFANGLLVAQTWEIRGRKYHDWDQNGAIGSLEPGLRNWTIYVDLNNNGVRDESDPSTLTGPQGYYVFRGVAPGDYVVRELVIPGWTQVSPPTGFHQVSMGPGQVVTDLDFGNASTGYRFFFPFFQGNQEFFTGFAFSNIGAQRSHLTLQSLDIDGFLSSFAENPSTRILESNTQLARLGRELFEIQTGEDLSAWVEVVTDSLDTAGFFQFGGPQQLDGGVPFDRLFRKLYFSRVFEGETAFRGLEAETFLSIANPSEGPVSVQLRLFQRRGAAETTPAIDVTGTAIPDRATVLSIPSRGFQLSSIRDLFGSGANGGYVEAEVIDGEGIVGFELISIPEAKTVIGLNAAAPSDRTMFYSAQLADGAGLFTSLKLINVGVRPVEFEVTPIGQDGSRLAPPASLALAPGESLESDVRNLFTGFSGSYIQGWPRQEDSLLGSIRISSNRPGLIGDVIFGDPERGEFAAALPLQSTPLIEAVFSQVANIPGFFTGLAFFNPNELIANVRIEVFAAGGERVGQSLLSVLPGNRTSQLVEELVPASAGQAGGFIRIRSSQPIVAQQLFGAVGSSGVTILSAVPPTVIR